MSGYDFDYFVIGAGSGGVRSARIARSHGATVAIAEETYMGGTCVNVGCVPKKLFSYAAQFQHNFEDAVGFGWDKATPGHDWSTLVKNKDSEIKRLNNIYRNMLEKQDIKILDGRARIVDEHTVSVNDKTYTADKILIAVGGTPTLPDHNGVEHAITSNEVFYLKDFPKDILIVGGGYIALEFASIFQNLGSNVTLFYRRDLFLRGFDTDVRMALRDEMIKQGVNIIFNSPAITDIDKIDDRLKVTLDNGEALETDQVLYAIGRKPLTEDLGLENVNIETDEAGAIKINEAYQTSVANIYAVGDVTNRINLTPVALNEGHVLADHLFNTSDRKLSYDNIATAVFTIPPLATCGLTEEQALPKYKKLRIYQSSFRPMKYTMSGRDEKTLMKLVVDDASDKVVGAHMMGVDTPEMMQAISIAMNMDATKADFDRTVGIHPTSAEEFVTMRSVSREVEI
jgi:glutathione reductase (NADPH)